MKRRAHNPSTAPEPEPTLTEPAPAWRSSPPPAAARGGFPGRRGAAVLAAVVLLGVAVSRAPAQPELPDFSAAVFSDPLTIDNPYFPLVPGATYTFVGVSGDDEGGETETEIIFVEVLDQTRTVAGIEARVVRDRVFLEGLLIEDTFDWYAQDDAGNVWYLGEEVTDFEYDDEGNLVGMSHPGQWEAGVDGALPGHIMKAEPQVGQNYYQEFYPGEAVDEGTVLEVGGSAEVPAGEFEDVVTIKDSSALFADFGHKSFAPGTGLVRELEFDEEGEPAGTVELVQIGRPGPPDLSGCTFASTGENPYLPLRPGLRLELEGEEEDDEGETEAIHVVWEVLDETRTITFTDAGGERSFEARVVRETETIDGELAEIARRFLAHCTETGDVYLFGEEADIYEEGEIVSDEGSWLAGTDGAQPGILMPGEPTLEAVYTQEHIPGQAEEVAEVTEVDIEAIVPAGNFDACIAIEEVDRLDPDGGMDEKIFAPGIGPVVDGALELTALSLGPVSLPGFTITELHYHPSLLTEAEIDAGFEDEDDFEFLEVTNTGEGPLDLAGAGFSQGVTFTFPAGPLSVLDPGETLLVVRSRQGMVARYGGGVLASVAGEFQGATSLRNRGETLIFNDAAGLPVTVLTYRDRGEWPEGADAEGPSLVWRRGSADGDDLSASDPVNWTLSRIPGGSPGTADDLGYALAEGTFASVGENPYFPLRPGLTLVLEGEEDGAVIRVVRQVLGETRAITFSVGGEERTVETRVIVETETEDGELVEISRNYFAHCVETGDVYYFGEDVDDYEDGEIVGHGGAWLAGVDGALPGVIMPGTFFPGDRYAQERAPGVAEDEAVNGEDEVEIELEVGTLLGAVAVTEFNPLEPGAEPSEKIYAPGVGLVVDVVVELVEFDLALAAAACTFEPVGENPYFPLRPGLRLVLEGEEEDEEGDLEFIRLVWEVLDETRSITYDTAGGGQLTVEARVIRETETIDDELAEISHNYYAHCVETGSVHYFGEAVDIYEDGEVVAHDGAWLAGVDGALPGIIMPGILLEGDSYAQEIAPGVAEDAAEHAETGAETEVPAGLFRDTLVVSETDGLEPAAPPSTKVYAPGIGLIVDDILELVDFDPALRISDCTFTATGENPYFPLRPGLQLTLEGVDEEEGHTVRLVWEVLEETEEVSFEFEGEEITVDARVVRETETAGDELVEISWNYYAHCVETGDVYYFGEAVDIYEDGEVVAHDGAWRAGEDGALPGIIMKGKFRVGDTYKQETAPGVAEDRAENVAAEVEQAVPAGTFAGSVVVHETNPLEPGTGPSEKVYAPGLGPVVDDFLQLVDFDLGLEFMNLTFAPSGENRYFPLRPGMRLVLEGEDEDEFVRVVWEALPETRTIALAVAGRPFEAVARVVRETETIDGELVEISWNYYAHAAETGDVYYFGEEVDIYEDGEVVAHDGAWLAGAGGAYPGIIMPGEPEVGDAYAQEIAPGVAQDEAEHIDERLDLEVPAGLFSDVILVEESTPLEPGADPSEKAYAPGVGLIVDDVIELVEFDLALAAAACTFASVGNNPYFPLRPGLRLVLEGEEEDEEGELEQLRLVWEVLGETRTITYDAGAGTMVTVEARVVRETETVDGELAEISRNFYAHCIETGSVHYFGEEVDIYEDGEVVAHDGAWLAGVDGALPGIIMPGYFIPGDRYAQEIAPGVAEDAAHNLEVEVETEVPAGIFEDTVVVEETDGLDPGAAPSLKVYAPGYGLILDDVLRLTEADLGVPDLAGIAISEVNYNPADPSDEEADAGVDDPDAFEFVELINTGAGAIDLAGAVFTRGFDFTFPEGPGSVLAPGAALLVVRDREAMAVRYGEAVDALIAGEFEGGTGLSNRGEGIELSDAAYQPVLEFDYDDREPWPEGADGGGQTLAWLGGDAGDPASWGNSHLPGGSPGHVDDLAYALLNCTFSAYGDNPLFPLRPGLRLELEGEEEDDEGDLEMIHLVWEVTADTRRISFEVAGETVTVDARVLTETETIDGELYEISRNYYAECVESGSVYYFGEEVDFYEDGEIVGHEGAWLAGVEGALPGIIMPGLFTLGDRYNQEFAPGVAEDRAEHAEEDLEVELPAGTFTGVVAVNETNPLEPDGDPSEKLYAPGIGLVTDDVLELVSFRPGAGGFPGVEIGAIEILADGRVCLTVTNASGLTFELAASGDLAGWETVAEIPAGEETLVEEEDAADAGRRFYRLEVAAP